MNKLSVFKLEKEFGLQKILQGLSLEVGLAEIIGILGPSGCGKTTLLRCLAQLENMDSGSITLNQSNNKKHKIGMVFQQYHLWPHLTVLSNLIMAPQHVLGLSKAAATAQALSLLETFDLQSKAASYPTALSGGEQQRVAIARALMMQPEILLFDEPTAALDPERCRDLITIIKKLAEQKVTILIASHDVGFIEKVATRVVFLDQGQVAENAPIFSGKISPTTARFEEFLLGVQS